MAFYKSYIFPLAVLPPQPILPSPPVFPLSRKVHPKNSFLRKKIQITQLVSPVILPKSCLQLFVNLCPRVMMLPSAQSPPDPPHQGPFLFKNLIPKSRPFATEYLNLLFSHPLKIPLQLLPKNIFLLTKMTLKLRRFSWTLTKCFSFSSL